jgi:hypothetical protein
VRPVLGALIVATALAARRLVRDLRLYLTRFSEPGLRRL